MTIFTDISAAIEEARFLRHETKHHHVVTQKRNGTLTVRQEVGINKVVYVKYIALVTIVV
ncbi:hypothetical protein CE143_20145 [Photorhabdus luminescens]|uniref:Uncharacterized protein n=1 Tax=Photorhabdus akhurstii TaxID=171438 RepID=A0ABX8M240_9GAMM|nr:hypothetical protein B0X70_20100 [Photorhabdus akhurstii]UJD77056.1 hypothetical protein CE143_20145 [Photorhabdus luminescens]